MSVGHCELGYLGVTGERRLGFLYSVDFGVKFNTSKYGAMRIVGTECTPFMLAGPTAITICWRFEIFGCSSHCCIKMKTVTDILIIIYSFINQV